MHSRSFGESLGNAFIHALSTVDDINERFDFMNESIRIGLIIRDKDEFVIDANYEQHLRERISSFRAAPQTKQSLLQTFVTTYGVKRNIHSGIVASEIKMDDLFE